MPSKEQLSDEVNGMLDTDFDWSRMKKEDLKLFHELIQDGHLLEPMAKQVAKKHGKQKIDEEIDDWHMGKYLSKVI